MPDRYRGDVAGDRPQPAFDPLGVRVGSFLARMDGEVDIGYNSNLYGRTRNKVADGYLRLRPSLRVHSDWGRDAVELSGRAELTRFMSESSQNSNEFWLHAGGEKEIGDRITIRPNLDYAREVEPRGSAENSFTVGSPVIHRNFSGNIGGTYQGAQFGAELLLAYRQQRFEPISVDGVLVSQKLRDTQGVGGRATLLYKVTPSISALVQGVADDTHNPHREFCCQRSAHGHAVLAGVRIDPSGLVAGQIAVGFRRRFFEATNTSSKGFTYDVRLQWYPTELVTIGLKAEQQFRNSGILMANAVLVDKQTVSATYEMYRDLNFYLEANREASDYSQVDAKTKLKSIGLRATYTSRRFLQLSAYARYEATNTNRPLLASEFDALRAGLSARIRI